MAAAPEALSTLLALIRLLIVKLRLDSKQIALLEALFPMLLIFMRSFARTRCFLGSKVTGITELLSGLCAFIGILPSVDFWT